MPFGINFGGGGGGIDKITGEPQDDSGTPVKRELNTDDFDTFGGSVEPGKETEIATLKVDSDVKMRWGYGSANNPENQGFLYVDLQSGTPNPVEGQIAFYVESATRRTSHFVTSYDTERLDASKTDKTNMVPLPLQKAYRASEDSYLVIYLNAASSNTDQSVDESQSDVIIPATEYDLS